MARTILVEASPWDPATGAVVPVRLAGAGRRHFTHKGHTDWLAGVVAAPKVTAAFGFEQGGFTGGAIPQVAAIGFMPARRTTRDHLARLLWNGAAVTIASGDDDSDPPAWTVGLAGTVAGYAIAGGGFTFTVSDMAGALAKPLVTATFTGAGGIEGDADVQGRLKRRSLGRCWNVEGRLLLKAHNIHEFGDPARPLRGFAAVKDRGRVGSLVLVGWQGSIAATLAALIAAAAPDGGAAIAPSIACVKWWTSPSGPLTADLLGEVGPGYAETVPGIAARIAEAAAGPAVRDLAALVARRPDPAGLHVDTDSETAAAMLDRLLLPASFVWSIDPAGWLDLGEIAFADPVATVLAESIEREATFAPATSVAVGYRRNHRQHGDGEISAAVMAADVTYADGQTGEDLKPAQPGATAGAPAGTAVAGRPAEDVIADLVAAGVANAQALLAAANVQAQRLLDRALYYPGPQGESLYTLLVREVTQRETENEAFREVFELLLAVAPDQRSVILQAATVMVAPGLTLAQKLDSLATAAGLNTASIEAIQQAAVDYQASVAQQITNLTAKFDGNTASIHNLEQAVATEHGAVAQALQNLTAGIGGNSASITDLREVVYGPNGSAARAMITLDVAGRAAGVVATNTGAVSKLKLLFDAYEFLTPAGTSIFSYSDPAVGGDGKTYLGDVVAQSLAIRAVKGVNLDTGSMGKAGLFFRGTEVVVTSGGWRTIASTTVTSRYGKPIKINFSCFARAINGGGSNSTNVLVRVRRGDTVIWPSATGQESRLNERGLPFTFFCADGSTVGMSATYIVEVRQQVAGETSGYSACTLYPEELSSVEFDAFDVSSADGAGPAAGISNTPAGDPDDPGAIYTGGYNPNKFQRQAGQ